MTHPSIDTEAAAGSPSFAWDVNTALAAIILGALLFLVLIARGFKGFNVAIK